MVAVAQERWSLTRGGRLQEVPVKGFGLETFGILENWSLRRGGRLREMVAYCKRFQI